MNGLVAVGDSLVPGERTFSKEGSLLPRRVVRVLATVLLTLAALAALAGQAPPAAAADPPFIPWSELLPGLTDEYQPSSANACVAGRPNCVDAIVREMERRFELQGRSCHHEAAFGLAYLRTTQTFRWASNTEGFFADPYYVNHEAAVFAKYYFNAYDHWAAGNRSAVPAAWLIAFDKAQAGQITGSGNLLLGMSAHINRDLPFVLAAIGLVGPGGESRKPDHDQVDEFLNVVTEPLLAEEAARFDPATINLATPFGIGYTGLFQLIQAWRELAWRHAEMLVLAADPPARAVVVQAIETNAALQAHTLASANSYLPPLLTRAPRDAYCAVHNAADAPMEYAFGPAAPY
jgi:hypothetical protein